MYLLLADRIPLVSAYCFKEKLAQTTSKLDLIHQGSYMTLKSKLFATHFMPFPFGINCFEIWFITGSFANLKTLQQTMLNQSWLIIELLVLWFMNYTLIWLRHLQFLFHAFRINSIDASIFCIFCVLSTVACTFSSVHSYKPHNCVSSGIPSIGA